MSKLADLLKQFPNLPPAEQQEILNSPGMTPPDGVEPNFDHPANRNDLAIAISVICLFLVTFSASVRAYSKLALVKRVRLEDCTLPMPPSRQLISSHTMVLLTQKHEIDLGVMAFVCFCRSHMLASSPTI